MPLFIRKFIVDALETAIAALVVLPLAGDPEAIGHAALTAIGVAFLAAARRAAPGFIAFVREQLGVPAD